MSLIPSIILKLWCAVSFAFLLRKKSVVVLVLVSLLVQYHPTSKREVTGRVVAIQEHRFVLRVGVRNFKVYAKYQGSLDDTVLVKGSFDYDSLTATDASRSIVGEIRKVSFIKTLKEGNSFRSALFRRFTPSHLLQAIVFGMYHEDFVFLSSLAMQVSGFLMLVKEVLRRYLSVYQVRRVEAALILIYLVVFGFSYSVFRLLMGRLSLKRDHQMLVLLCLFPGSSLSLVFLFPYGFDLIRGFSSRFSELKRMYVIPILIRLLRYRLNLIEMIAFRLNQVICGIFFVLAMFSVILPLEKVLFALVQVYHSLLQAAWMRRFDLNGTLSGMLLLCVLLLYYFGKKKQSFTLWLLVLVQPLYPMSWRVTYLDVGQGDATLIQAPFNAYTILIDTGPPNAFYKLSRSFERLGVSVIDVLVLTHDDLDHVGNVESLETLTCRIVRSKDESVPFLQSYLNDHYYPDENNNSLLFSFTTRSVTHLFMGDAGQGVERDFIKKHPHLRVDVLKLGHHGSRTSTSEAFLASLRPRYAVISSRPSTYNHPHPEVMRSLYRFRVRAIQTHDSGNIRFFSGILFDYVLTDRFGFGIIR